MSQYYMEQTMSAIVVLVGNDTKFNRTIAEIIDSFRGFTISVTNLAQFKKAERNAEITIVDLTSINDEPTKVLTKISEITNEKPILAIHHYSDERIIKEIKSSGANAYLNSDLNEELLYNTLTDLLQPNELRLDYEK